MRPMYWMFCVVALKLWTKGILLSFLWVSLGFADAFLDKLYRTHWVLGDRAFDLWVALDAQQRRQGLRDVSVMRENQGMLFCFPVAQTQYFSMAETAIDLDIVFLKADGKIVDIFHNVPRFSKETIVSSEPAMFALELRAGVLTSLGLLRGERLILPDDMLGLLDL